MTVQEIETAIAQLPREDVAKLLEWLDAYHERVWDRQIADDLDSGRLDTLLAEVDKEYTDGLAKPL